MVQCSDNALHLQPVSVNRVGFKIVNDNIQTPYTMQNKNSQRQYQNWSLQLEIKTIILSFSSKLR